MMIGVFGEKMIRLATRYADIIHCMFDPNPENLMQQKQRILTGCEKNGRNPQEIRIASGYTIWLDPTEEEINERVKRLHVWMNIPEETARQIVVNAPSTPEAHIETIRKAIEDGVTVFTLMGPQTKLKTFAEQVVSKLK
jgi:alkanesulfonate monooxygenase SsuD/methylene tetrahydromethanopterin reductase-like flavin-dependent oxidoreductase (luciferase family)